MAQTYIVFLNYLTGIPMITMPIFVDQPHNSIRQQHHGFGKHLDFWTFTSSQLSKTIREVINNSTYRDAIGQASRIYRDRPMNAKETTSYWTNHVVQFGASHMRSHAYDMPFYQFLMLDIIAVVLAIVIVIIIGLFCIIR